MSELAPRIEAAIVASTGAAVCVLEVVPLAGGACQDLLAVTIAIGGVEEKLVLRSDARSSLPGSLSRADEFQVINAAVAAGVRTPRARWLSHDLLRPNSSAYFLDWVGGTTLGKKVLSLPELAGARQHLANELAEQLATIHSISPDSGLRFSEPQRDSALASGPVDAALTLHRRALDNLDENHPAIELALVWLDSNRPPPGPLSLVHGDFRTGNFAVSEAGLEGILDWEFARWSDPEEDLGWLCVRDWRFGNLDRAAFGLCPRQQFIDSYAAASGRSINRKSVFFWEVMGNVRWAVGALFQGQRYLRGEQLDIELLAIGYRAQEIQYEILRLLEKGCP